MSEYFGDRLELSISVEYSLPLCIAGRLKAEVSLWFCLPFVIGVSFGDIFTLLDVRVQLKIAEWLPSRNRKEISVKVTNMQ